jgi:hypothetical protein
MPYHPVNLADDGLHHFATRPKIFFIEILDATRALADFNRLLP